MGDSERWQATPAASGDPRNPVPHVAIKPQAPGIRTNLAIYTTRHIYHLNPRSKPAHGIERTGRHGTSGPFTPFSNRLIPIASESSNSIKRLCGVVRPNSSGICRSYRWQQEVPLTGESQLRWYRLRLCHRVETQIPRVAAASSSVGSSASTRRICSSSICSSVERSERFPFRVAVD